MFSEILQSRRCSSRLAPNRGSRSLEAFRRKCRAGEKQNFDEECARAAIVGDVEPTLAKEILDVSVAEREAQVEPDSMLDDNRRKAVATI